MDYIEYYTKHPLYSSTIRKRGIIRIVGFIQKPSLQTKILSVEENPQLI